MNRTYTEKAALTNILQGQSVKVELRSEDNAELTISWPSLSHYPKKVWGDWGSFYKVEITDKKPISFVYEEKNTGTLFNRDVLVDTLEIGSPISVEVREKNPLYIDFNDDYSNLKIRCFFDHLGTLCRTELFPRQQQ